MILLQFILVHYAIMLIAFKYDARTLVRNFSQKVGAKKWGKIIGKFLYNVSECLFCLTHHIGVMLLPFLIMGNGFKIVFLLYPLMSAGAMYLLDNERAV